MAAPLNTSRKRYRKFLELRGKKDERKKLGDGAPSPAERRRMQAKRYWTWLVPHKGPLAVVVVCAVVGIGIDMVWPLVSRYVIDGVILDTHRSANEKLRTLGFVALGMATLYLTNSLLNLVRAFRMQLVNSKLAFGLRTQLFERILHLPMNDISEMKTGGIISRLSNDVDNTTGLLQMALVSPALSTLRLVVTLAIIFRLDWRIATAIIVAMPLVMLAQNLWIRRIRPIWRSMGQDRSEIDGRVSEGLSGIRVVRGFRREQREEFAYAVGHHTVIRKQMLATGTQRAVALVWDLVMPLTQVTIVCYGGYLVIQGQTTLGTLTAFSAYVWRLLDPIMQIVNAISETQRGLAAMDRVFEVLDMPPEKPDPSDAIVVPSRVAELRFDHVDFEYRKDTPVIHDFDLTVRGGSVVALVGPSGAGKTTVTDLVARFHDPTNGAILLNGIDARKIKLKSYRSLLGIVQQEVFLFDGSVHENIAYGRRDVMQGDVLKAARRANAHEFIDRLPDKYETMIGERGVKLSGGQRQRLSIARALLADPQILILDEATSNLDTESEQLIQASMKELLANRTTFVIAHRLSTITHADVIVVLDRGKIVEVGTHDELLARRGVYFAMVMRQQKRAAGDSMGEVSWEELGGDASA
jgi:ATP-binding cassette, subfamily B, bacterial